MPTRSLNVVISGDARDLNRTLGKVNKDAKESETHLARLGNSGSKSLGHLKTAAAGAGIALAAGIVVGVKKSAQAAIEAEKANARLQAQLKASGISYREHAKAIQESIDKTSQLSGLDDEDLGDSFTNIVRITGDVNEALKLNGLAADIARAKNIDVAKAGQLVAKAYDGNVGALKRYGVTVTPVTAAVDKLKASNDKVTAAQMRAAKESDKHATSQKALAAATRTFSGQAEAYGKTTAGAADRAKVSLQNLGETIGAKITPLIAKAAEWFNKLVRQITLGEGPGGRIRKVFEGLVGTIGGTVKVISGLVRGFQQGNTGAVILGATLAALAAGFVTFKAITLAVAAATKIAAAAQLAMNLVLTANPIGIVVVALAGLAAALVVAYKKSETFRKIVDGVFNAIRTTVTAVVGFVKEHWKLLLGILTGPFGAAAILIATHLGKIRATVSGAVGAVGGAASRVAHAIVDAFDFVKRLPGRIGGWIGDGIQKIRGLEQRGRNAALDLGKSIVTGVLGGLGNLGHVILSKVKDALGWVGSQIGGAASSLGKKLLGPLGDGVGKTASGLGFMGSTGGAGSLMGADRDLMPFASIAGRMGLQTTSGLRPGSITSSGNVSYHSSGDAIDESGPPGAMLRYFKFLRGTFGSRLRELIYTPGGVGIKDGRPYRYTGAVAADHMDHVHVAYTGPFGDGRGRTGDGIGQIKNLWTRAGGRPAAANMAAAIAMAESSGDPHAVNRNSDGSIDRGLWQINSVHGSLSTFGRLANAKAAVSISGNGRNWNPWTTFKSGAFRSFLSNTGGGGHPMRTHAVVPMSARDRAQQGHDNATDSEAVSLREARRGRGRRGRGRGGFPSRGDTLKGGDGTSLVPDAADTGGGGGDPNQPLIDALAANTTAVTAHDQSLKDVKAEIKRQTDFATSVQTTEAFQLKKYLAEIYTGMAGRGIVARAFTPGVGTEVAY